MEVEVCLIHFITDPVFDQFYVKLETTGRPVRTQDKFHQTMDEHNVVIAGNHRKYLK